MYSDIGLLIFFLVFCLIYLFIIIGGMAVWIWALIDSIRRDNYQNEDEKIIWVIVIGITGFIGGIIYYFAVRRRYGKISI